MISYEPEELQVLEELETNGKYYIYDTVDKRWLFLGRGHAPLSMITCGPPDDYASLASVLKHNFQRIAVRVVIRTSKFIVDKLGGDVYGMI